MTLRHLRFFVTVAKCGKMSTAAQQLFIAQSSVSQTIIELENHYGFKLFERLSRKLYITPMGEPLLTYAQHILALFDEMETQMKTRSERAGLRIGATISAGTCMLSQLLTHFRTLYGALETTVIVELRGNLESMLLRSELDLLLLDGHIPNPDFITLPIARDQMVLICSPEHPFAARGSVTTLDISQENFICRDYNSDQPELFEEYMRMHDLPLRGRWFSVNSETTKRAVRDNHGITVISRQIVSAELTSGELVEVPIEGLHLERDVCLVYHKNKFVSPCMREFLDFAIREGGELSY